MELKIAKETDQKLWDGIVERSPNGTLFHTWNWLKLMEKYSSMKNAGIKSFLFPQEISAQLFPVILMEKDCPVGIFPLFFFKNPVFNFCYSPPSNVRTATYLGPLFPDIETMKQEKMQIFFLDAQREIDRFLKKELKSKYIVISTPPGFEDCRAYKWSGYTVEPRYTYHIDLTSGTDVIWKSFNRSLRYYIEKARKQGINVIEGNKDDSFYIYDLLAERNRDTFPKEFLGEVYDLFFPDHMKIFIAKVGSECLSGIITIINKDKVSFWAGAPKCSYKGLSPNELVLWESIRWAGENGYKTYEIIGADDFSLFPFKRKFNGKIIPYFQMIWFSPSINLVSSVYHSLKKGNINELEG
jgi:hypothetical protein